MEMIARLLNEKGLKATTQRIAIYHYLKNTDAHPKAETIYDALRPQYPALSLATVYKTLDSLHKAGIIDELHTGGESFRYDADTTPHPHLQCVGCGAVLDMNPKVTEGLLQEAKSFTDCELYSERVYFYGLCSHCKTTKKPA